MLRDKYVEISNKIIDYAIGGAPPFKGAVEIAEIYINNPDYINKKEMVKDLIRIECSKNFATGFISGFGGLFTLGVSVSSSIAFSWVIQARMVAAIAYIYGYDLQDEKIRTLIKLALLGDSVKEILKGAGVRIASKITADVLIQLPWKVFSAINKKIGFKIMNKLGNKSVAGLLKIVPVVGGVISGGIDSVTTKKIGITALSIFEPK